MPANALRLHCYPGDCECGNTGLLTYLSIDAKPVTWPVCPPCFKPLADKVIERLFAKNEEPVEAENK